MVTETAVLVTNTGSGKLTLNPKLSGDSSYSIVTAKSCGTTLAAGKSCDMCWNTCPPRLLRRPGRMRC